MKTMAKANKGTFFSAILLVVTAGLIITVSAACGGDTEGQRTEEQVAATKTPAANSGGLDAPPAQPSPAALQKATNPPLGLVPPRATSKTATAKVEGDEDFDGVSSNEDNCADHWNPCQQDIDGDNAGDPCDTDIDGDGIDNAEDNCPLHRNPIPTGQTEQADEDGDDVGDACDVAPRNSKNSGMLSPYSCCDRPAAAKRPRRRNAGGNKLARHGRDGRDGRDGSKRAGTPPAETTPDEPPARRYRQDCYFNFGSAMACRPRS